MTDRHDDQVEQTCDGGRPAHLSREDGSPADYRLERGPKHAHWGTWIIMQTKAALLTHVDRSGFRTKPEEEQTDRWLATPEEVEKVLTIARAMDQTVEDRRSA